VALLARLAVVGLTPGYVPTGDPADYDRHAAALAETGRFAPSLLAEPGSPSALRPPLYPLALAGTYELTGARWGAGRVLGVLLGVLSVALLFAVASRLLPRAAALWAAGLAAVFPPLTWLAAGLAVENLFVPLVLGATLALLRLRDRRAPRDAVLAGALIGLAAMTRSNGIVLVLPALLLVAGLTLPPRRRLAVAGVLLAAVVVVLTPWTVRNADVLGGLHPLGTQSGYTTAGVFNPDAANPDDFEGIWRTPESVPALRGLFRRPGVDEAQLDAELQERGVDFATDRPGYALGVVHRNARRLFDVGPNTAFVRDVSYGELGVPATARAQLSSWLWIVCALAAAGAVLLLRRGARPPVWLVAIPVLLLASVVWVQGSAGIR
jgi:hypothetical protein